MLTKGLWKRPLGDLSKAVIWKALGSHLVPSWEPPGEIFSERKFSCPKSRSSQSLPRLFCPRPISPTCWLKRPLKSPEVAFEKLLKGLSKASERQFENLSKASKRFPKSVWEACQGPLKNLLRTFAHPFTGLWHSTACKRPRASISNSCKRLFTGLSTGLGTTLKQLLKCC